jgi:hypothetical protein
VKVPFTTLLTYLAAVVIVGLIIAVVDRQLHGRAKTALRWASALIACCAIPYIVGKIALDDQKAVGVVKAMVAITAAGCVFYELHRVGQRRPVAERWKKFVGITLGVAAICLYFNAFKFGYPKYYHRWDQYHYYMGAKYFPEIGYDGLYKCSAIAQDDIGVVQREDDHGTVRSFNLRAEVRAKDKTIRNLSGDNLLMKLDDLLKKPEECKDRFTPERWEAYKNDVAFFRTQSDLKYWSDMQRDHGYNPPPVWTVAGNLLGNLSEASVPFMQFLASLDIFYLLGVFIAIYWAFGWRIFAVAAILWGTQSSAPFYWTGGAFLRQDWLFFFVMAICLARKRWFALAGASMVYAGLLRIFPGLAVIGWLTVAGIFLVRHKRMHRDHLRALLGGTVAAALLIGASMVVVGKDSFHKFYEHTIRVHDQTPLTNHMGLRVLVGHDVGFDKLSGRMKYTKAWTIAAKKMEPTVLVAVKNLDLTTTLADEQIPPDVDPFETWKFMRLHRYNVYKPVAYGLLAMTFLGFVLVLRRVKSLWVAQCLGQIWIILLSQLTCYYYSFILASAPLTRLRRDLEVWLYGFAAITQMLWILGYNDDRYTALTLVTLVLCYMLLFAFAHREGNKQRIIGGITFGGLVALVPGLIFAVMGAMNQDTSTVLIGAGVAAAGVAILVYGRMFGRGPAGGSGRPDAGNVASSGTAKAAA